MSKTTVVIAAVAALAAGTLTGTGAAAGTPTGPSPVVRTADGAVRGTLTGTARVFHGIPYAAPPARWKAPRPVRAWRGVRDATEPGAACAQSGAIPVKGPKSDAEDCLFVNVTTPRAEAPAPRPVMVWLHGGDHEDGEGAMYGAQRLAAGGDVVVVTVNYRLGALGYLGDGNFGLQDQQAALRWVRANAAAFGGDPRNVTLFGESGGARSICANLVSPASAGLFHRAVLQSGPCLDDDETLTRAEALRHARHLEGKFKKPLRTVSAAELVAADDEETRYGPVYGTRLLPDTPREAFASGRFNRVPVLHGINRDEETFRVYGLELSRQRLLDEHDVRAYVTGAYGAEVAEKVLARYPASAYGGSYGRALAAAMTDAVWGRSAIATDDALGAHADVRVRVLRAGQPVVQGLPAGELPGRRPAPRRAAVSVRPGMGRAADGGAAAPVRRADGNLVGLRAHRPRPVEAVHAGRAAHRCHLVRGRPPHRPGEGAQPLLLEGRLRLLNRWDLPGSHIGLYLDSITSIALECAHSPPPRPHPESNYRSG
jgi:para-nitrobenzyl esterase